MCVYLGDLRDSGQKVMAHPNRGWFVHAVRWPCEDAQVDQRRTDPRLEQHYMAHTQYTLHNESVEKDPLPPGNVLAAL